MSHIASLVVYDGVMDDAVGRISVTVSQSVLTPRKGNVFCRGRTNESKALLIVSGGVRSETLGRLFLAVPLLAPPASLLVEHRTQNSKT